MKIPNCLLHFGLASISLARIVSEDSQPGYRRVLGLPKSSKDS